MASQEQLDILKESVKVWNQWRESHRLSYPGALPDLSDADLHRAELDEADLSEANLKSVRIDKANLTQARLEPDPI